MSTSPYPAPINPSPLFGKSILYLGSDAAELQYLVGGIPGFLVISLFHVTKMLWSFTWRRVLPDHRRCYSDFVINFDIILPKPFCATSAYDYVQVEDLFI